MAERGEYKFHIDVFTPLTLPMTRLKDYIVGLVSYSGTTISFISCEWMREPPHRPATSNRAFFKK
jgi:hypothetical protein